MDAINRPAIDIVRTTAELRQRVKAWHKADQIVGVVPTMGALHDGHLSLVDRSLATTDRTIVTLFVNPKQFGPHEDFGVYPRDEERDRELLATRGVHLLFAPDLDEMYPRDFMTSVSVSGLGDILDGSCRPGFFNGVSTVVAKLFMQCQADAAFFGEKDYQQVRVVRCMARDLAIPTDIVACPTIRGPGGLALSSRNAYLSSDELARATALHAELKALASDVRAGGNTEACEARATSRLLNAGFAKVDYMVARDADTLQAWMPGRPLRALGAAFMGRTRLIDNVAG
jgi:pantoate--beta-alanine ligase